MLSRSLNNINVLSVVYCFVKILIDLTDKVIFFILLIGLYIYFKSLRSISDIVYLLPFLLLQIWASYSSFSLN